MRPAFYDFKDELQKLRRQSLYRRRQITHGPQQVMIDLNGKLMLNFCSNDYLGLANHPLLSATLKQAADQYGSGSGSAHLVCGHSAAHHALEEELAAFTGRERALLFSTGYMANLGVISALVSRKDTVFSDRLNHASLLDGVKLSTADLQRYRHLDMVDLQEKLAAFSGRALIATDSVFSMDGDLAPLPALAALAEQYQAGLLVDDAHGFGVLGEQGAGSIKHFGLNQQQVPILMATLGKACGSFGAFVAGPEDLIEYLIQKARTYIYTTALPAAQAEVSRVGLKLLSTEEWRRDKLTQLIQRFKQGAAELAIPLAMSATPIQPIMVGDSQSALQYSQRLLDLGFWVSAIRPPTVPAGSARLRVSFSANHEEWQVDALLDALATLAI